MEADVIQRNEMLVNNISSNLIDVLGDALCVLLHLVHVVVLKMAIHFKKKWRTPFLNENLRVLQASFCTL